ncbi:MAG: glutaredoxin domain-containing protein [Thiobacillus sp.]|nr:glutaredoxin domain-containing protein [Thiobacillus sp.]
MKRLLVSFGWILLVLSPIAHAWDPVSVFNNAVQGQVNRQINRGVNEAFRSITTPSTSARPSDVDIREARPGEVVIYTTPTCGYCKRALAHMQSRKIPYLEKDVSANAQAQSEWQSLGGRGVPLALFGSQKLNGFAAASYDKAWARFQAEQASATPAGAVQTSTSAQPTAVPSGPVANGFTPGDVLIARIARVKLLDDAQPQAKVLGQLAKHEEVIYLGETQGRYLRVKGADAEGWAEQSLLGKP